MIRFCAFFFLIYGCSTVSISKSKIFLIKKEYHLSSPKIIKKYKENLYKGRYFFVRGYQKRYYFIDYRLMMKWLRNKGLLSDTKVLEENKFLQVAVNLMKEHRQKVIAIRDQGVEKDIFYREFERFINSRGNPFYRKSSRNHRVYTGYITGGIGYNYCKDTIDTTWGLDCSGLVYLVYRMNGKCFPRINSKNLWALYHLKEGKRDLYSKETVEDFFYIVEDPRPGDIILQSGHVSLYVNQNLAIGMNGSGISFELFKKRDKNIKKSRPQFLFVRLKDKELCHNMSVRKYMKKKWSLKDKRYIRHLHPLFFKIDNGFVVLSDFWGAGSKRPYCKIHKKSIPE